VYNRYVPSANTIQSNVTARCLRNDEIAAETEKSILMSVLVSSTVYSRGIKVYDNKDTVGSVLLKKVKNIIGL